MGGFAGASVLISTMNHVISSRIYGLGRFMMFLVTALKGMVYPPLSGSLVFEQFENVGYRSTLVIILAGTSTGMVFGIQFSDLFRVYSAESLLGSAAVLSLSKEIAPVLGAFVVGGRTGSSMAAEIALMRINQEIDAIRLMGVNPVSYLVTPRILAATIMMPFLVVIFIGVSLGCTFLMGVTLFNVDAGMFFENIPWLTQPKDVIIGLMKSAVFGFILASLGCYKGYYARSTTKGVGRATASAVVTSLTIILVVDFLISYLQNDFS